MSSPIAARIEIFRVLFDKAADISRPIGNPGLFPRGSRHVSPVVTCWTVHVNLIETFRLAAYVYTRKMCYSRNASTKVPGNRKVNRFLSRRRVCVCVCVQLAAKRATTLTVSEKMHYARWRVGKKRRSIGL